MHPRSCSAWRLFRVLILGIVFMILGLHELFDADIDSSVADMRVELCKLLKPDVVFGTEIGLRRGITNMVPWEVSGLDVALRTDM